eukprot:195947-Pelagomonas_calceolata.AAC.1
MAKSGNRPQCFRSAALVGGYSDVPLEEPRGTDKLRTKRPEFEHTRLRRQKKQHGSLIGGMGECMGVLKGCPYPVLCLGETTEGTYLLKRFKQGNATDTFS